MENYETLDMEVVAHPATPAAEFSHSAAEDAERMAAEVNGGVGKRGVNYNQLG